MMDVAFDIQFCFEWGSECEGVLDVGLEGLPIRSIGGKRGWVGLGGEVRIHG